LIRSASWIFEVRYNKINQCQNIRPSFELRRAAYCSLQSCIKYSTNKYQYQWSKYQYKYQYLTYKYQYQYKYCA